MSMEDIEDAALIESVFGVNEELIMLTGAMETDVVGPFCVEGDSVFSFTVMASFFESSRVPNVVMRIYDDGDVVAMSTVNDN